MIPARGNNNTFLGNSAGIRNTEGDDNTFLGSLAGRENRTGYANTFIGRSAGQSNMGGGINTFLGYNAGYSNTTGQSNVFIGNAAGYSERGSNKLYIDNSSTSDPLIYGDFDSKTLRINGQARVTGDLFVDRKVGIGRDAPDYSLDIRGDRIQLKYDHPTFGERWIAMRADGSVLDFQFEGGNLGIQSTIDGEHICLNPSRASIVGIGTWGPTQKLDVNGNARFRSVASGAYDRPLNLAEDGTLTTATSDGRLKTKIEPIEDGMAIVEKLQGVRFNWKENPEGARKIGLIAQDVEKVLPELTFTNPTGRYLGVNYAELSAVLVDAVKTQQQAIEDLQRQLASLQKAVQRLIARQSHSDNSTQLSAYIEKHIRQTPISLPHAK